MTLSPQAVATHVFDRLFNHADVSVVDTHIGAGYIQHSPAAADGPDGVRGFIAFTAATFPDTSATIHHVVADGDLVALHTNIVAVPGTPGYAAIDIFRVADGKVVEHWDASEPVPETSLHDNDPFSTSSTPVDSQVDPAAPTEANRATVVALVTALGVDHDAEAVDRLVAADFVQHDPRVGDGPDGLRALLAAPGRHDVEIKRVIAEGDYVAVHGHWHFADDAGVAIIDLYRVRDGQVVEHWSARQPVPAESANSNPMF